MNFRDADKITYLEKLLQTFIEANLALKFTHKYFSLKIMMVVGKEKIFRKFLD